MGSKGEPDTKTNWSTDCRPQDELQTQKSNDRPLPFIAEVKNDGAAFPLSET
jgi:hypothetical protein